MRVLIVTNMFLSGNGNWVAEQVRSLQAEGVDVDVLFFNTKRTRLYYGMKMPELARRLRTQKYDLVHTHHTYTMLMAASANWLAHAHVPVVLTNHEPEILDRAGRTRSWHPTSRLRHVLAIKRFAAAKADHVIFVSRQLADGLAFHGRYDVIPCGVDLAKFRPLERTRCRERLGVPDGPPIVFFPADPGNARKRFPLADETLSIVRRARSDALLLTGGGVPAEEMVYYYNAADVVIQTSFCEASPTVVKEALACEIPVVSTDAGDTREVIEGVEYCAVCAEDPVALAARVVEALGHRASGGRRRLHEHQLGLPQVAKRLVHVYTQVVSRS